METFIVRIYRGGTSAKQELVGTVEHVGSGDRVGFSGYQQLLDRLLMPERCADRGRNPCTLDSAERTEDT